MIPCIMIGDSIAVGVGQARPECETVARSGISSGRYVSTLLPLVQASAGKAVISLGVNDGDTADTLDNLREVRRRVTASSVVWLLPGLKEPVRDMIRTVAAENGDRTLDTRPQVGRDHLHPTGAGYERIAAATIGQSEDATEVAYAPDEPRPRTTSAIAARSQRRIARHGAALRTRTAHATGHGVERSRSAGHARQAAPRATMRAAAPRTLAPAGRLAKVKPAAARPDCMAVGCRARLLRG